MGPIAFLSYTRILEAALSSQLFKDPECWSGQGLNPQPPAQQAGTFPTELTRQLHTYANVIHVIFSNHVIKLSMMLVNFILSSNNA